MNSRDKGKRGERELAKELQKYGYEARRGVQYQGGPESPDVVCPQLEAFHIEVKRTERFQLYPALQQAHADAKDCQIPLVAHRKNRHPWIVCLTLDDFMSLLNDA